MPGTKLTFSATGRAKHCAWAYRDDVDYPLKPEWLERRDADDGHEVHEMLEHWLAGEPVPAMGPRAALIFEQVKQGFGEQSGTPEPSWAISLTTGNVRYLGNRLKRQYGVLQPDEIAGTADWCALGEVGDLKTGFAGHVPHPREHLQQLCAAYCVAKLEGTTSCLVRTLIAREDEYVPLFAKLQGPEWMEAVLKELRDMHYRTRLPSPAVAGEHCQFCPAMGACPQTAHLTAIAESGSVVRWTTESLSAENDAQMVIHLPMVKKAVKAIEDALKTRAPIHLPDGKVWQETTKKVRQLDRQKVEQMLGERYASCLSEVEVSNGYRQVRPK